MGTDFTLPYPDNVVPQPMEQIHSLPFPCLTCPPDHQLQAIMFNCSELSVVRGWDTKTSIQLKEFFQPVDSFAEYELALPQSEITTISYGPISGSTANVLFVAIFPEYHHTTLQDQTQWKLEWRFQGSTAFQGLGRILMLSGTDDNLIAPIEIQNLTSSDIPIKLLIGN